jgi:hypothetical protein
MRRTCSTSCATRPLRTPLAPGNADALVRFVACADVALPLVKRGAVPRKLVDFVAREFAPQLDTLSSSVLESLRVIVELTPFMLADHARLLLPGLRGLLLRECPAPPATDAGASAPGDDAQLHFDRIECLLLALHDLGKKAPLTLNALTGIKQFTGQTDDVKMTDVPDALADLQARVRFVRVKAGEYAVNLRKVAKTLGAELSAASPAAAGGTRVARVCARAYRVACACVCVCVCVQSTRSSSSATEPR